MGRKHKPAVIIDNLLVEDLAAEGKALGRHEGKVIFFPFAAPGDRVKVQITKSKKDWAEGKVLEFISLSSDRTEPRCRHFTHCGGCKWQHIPYETQTTYKQRQVVEQLRRIAGIVPKEIYPVLQADPVYAYRNKVEFSFSTGRWRTSEEMQNPEAFSSEPANACGFHAPGRFDKVLELEYCHLTDESANAMRNFVRDFARKENFQFYDPKAQTGEIRNLLCRRTSHGERMAVLIFGPDVSEMRMQHMMQAVKTEFPDWESLMYAQNCKVNDSLSGLDFQVFSGRDYIEEEMDGLVFRISAPSFFQTNSFQTLAMYRKIREWAQLTGDELVYDLYTGTGTIALFMAPYARKVIGVEYVEEAVADARINAERNQIGHTQFFAGDMKDVLTREFVETHGRPDVLVTDPPRTGMHEDVVKRILEMEPQRIVYVSCNPATQARDLALMQEKYETVAVQPIDMFPHTHHIENMALIEKKTEK